MIRRAALLLVLPFLFACPGLGDEEGGEVPENPTWNDDVEGILGANCIFCHVETPQNGAPDGFRFDIYVSTSDDLGAFSMRCDIRNRAVLENPSRMPPLSRPAISGLERATLARWIEQGGVEFAGGPAGTPCN